MPNLHVPCSVLALRPTPTNPQAKSTGNLIEIRRHVSTSSEYQTILFKNSNNNNKRGGGGMTSSQTSSSSQITNSQDSSTDDNNNNGTTTNATTDDHQQHFHFYGFVLWSSGQDDRRLSSWLPISQIYFPDGSCLSSHESFQAYFVINNSLQSLQQDSSSLLTMTNNNTINFNALINRKVRSIIPADVRQKLVLQAPRQELDFLEERLRKDGEVPTLFYRIKYLDFTMQPWYYSPYDVVFHQFQTQSQKVPKLHQLPERYHHHHSQQQQLLSLQEDALTTTSTSPRDNNNNNNNGSSLLPCVNNESNIPGFLFDCHICPFTLQPFRFASELKRSLVRKMEDAHILNNNNNDIVDKFFHPPGKEYYRDEKEGLTIYELDGIDHVEYCRNLLLLARCFLENKLVGHDAGLYTFYVLTIDYDQIYNDSNKNNSEDSSSDNVFSSNNNHAHAHTSTTRFFAGYFSVEKGDPSHNLACVVVLPCFQSRGLGRFLISMSYEIPKQKYRQELEKQLRQAEQEAAKRTTKKTSAMMSTNAKVKRRKELEKSLSSLLLQQVGTPERPFSDLGEKMYFRYWEQMVWMWASKIATEMTTVNLIDDDNDEMTGSDDDDDTNSTSSSVEIIDTTDESEVKKTKKKNNNNKGKGKSKNRDSTANNVYHNNSDDSVFKGGNSKNKGKGKGKGKGNLHGNNNNNNNNHDENQESQEAMIITKTISEIAKEIGITAEDARETLLRVGLLHTTEKKTLKLLIPPKYSKAMTDKVMKIPNLIVESNFLEIDDDDDDEEEKNE